MFSWALNNDRGDMEINHCRDVKIVDLIGPATVRSHVLSHRELAIVWRAARSLDYPFGPLYRMLMLTGQRLAEIAEARWSEIDQGEKALIIPAERMKSKLTHVVPLTPAAIALLDGLPRFKGDCIFTTTTGRVPVSGFSKARARLDREVAKLGEVAPFDTHSFGRTVRTGLSGVVTPFIAERTIGHKQQGIQAHYDYWEYKEEKRRALELWEAKLLAIVVQKADALKDA